MKGPGIRIESDVRRVWRCPSCGQIQREPLDVTSVRCSCVRSGVTMKLAEDPKSPRIALRPEVRSVIDRLMAGEVIPRLTSQLQSSEGKPELTGGTSEKGHGEHSAKRKPRRDRDRQPDAAAPAAESTAPMPKTETETELVDEEPFGVGM